MQSNMENEAEPRNE